MARDCYGSHLQFSSLRVSLAHRDAHQVAKYIQFEFILGTLSHVILSLTLHSLPNRYCSLIGASPLRLRSFEKINWKRPYQPFSHLTRMEISMLIHHDPADTRTSETGRPEVRMLTKCSNMTVLSVWPFILNPCHIFRLDTQMP